MKKITFITLLLIAGQAQANIKMLYSKGTPFSLGRSYDIDRPYERKETCINYENTRWAHVDDGALSMSFNSKLVRNTTDLTKNLSIGVDLAAKAKFKVINAGANLNSKIVRNFKSHQDTLSYLVQAEYDFGIKEVVEPVLKEKYQQLINEGKHAEFIKRCGTYFIDSTNQMVLINVMLNMAKLNSEKKKLLNLSFGGNASYAGMSASAKATLVKSFDEAKKFGETSIKVETLGARPDVLDQFGSSNDLEKTLKAMASLMKGVKKETSMPVSFTFVSMERFGLVVPEYGQEKQDFLNKAFHLSLEYEGKINRLEQEVKDLKRHPSDGVKESLKYFISSQRQLAKIYQRFNKIVDNCTLKEECDLANLVMMDFEIIWPTDFIKNTEVNSICYYDGSNLNGFSKIVNGEFLHPELIKRIEFFRTSLTGRERLNADLGSLVLAPNMKRFSGVIDRSVSSDQSELYDLLFDANYEIVITNHLGMKQDYTLDQLEFGNCKY